MNDENDQQRAKIQFKVYTLSIVVITVMKVQLVIKIICLMWKAMDHFWESFPWFIGGI